MKRLIERSEFMGWQADSNPGPGEVPGQGEGLPELLAGFGHGGTQAGAPPSAALAAALEAAAGPEGRYEGADTDALVGVVRQWAAVESWAAAGKLGALRAMMREDGEGAPLLRRRRRPARRVGRLAELRGRRGAGDGAGVGGEPGGPGLGAGRAAAGHRAAARRWHPHPGEGEAGRGGVRASG